jgi:GntR family transcriptional repressor for pyruvate dehydrogenase complex
MQERLAQLTSARNETAFHAADIALHRAIAAGSQNPLIVLILDALVDFLQDVRIQATKNRKARGESLDAVVEQHRAVVTAIERGDPDGAEEAMREHLASTAGEFEGRRRRRSR